ncbi:uncharacterized protein LOC110426430 [Herrania umbratica]|uniref:Uncharacterized protein LOC110426430 n=1 Tax=Herrania umbratica TaxID=108875 RepID=A0A6J1BCS6_9ROSI|nr:uncharacterized protein LOC110426430 [Herrania umbratica]
MLLVCLLQTLISSGLPRAPCRRFSIRKRLLCFIPSPDPKSGGKKQLFFMAGKAAQSVVKAMGEYQYPWREKLAKYKVELSKGVWGYWELGAWKPLGISARRRARLRKEVLLAGQDWPYDPQRKEMRTKMKGHKCDRISAEKRENTANLMQKMPEMLLAYKKRRWEKKMKEEEKLKEK